MRGVVLERSDLISIEIRRVRLRFFGLHAGLSGKLEAPFKFRGRDSEIHHQNAVNLLERLVFLDSKFIHSGTGGMEVEDGDAPHVEQAGEYLVEGIGVGAGMGFRHRLHRHHSVFLDQSHEIVPPSAIQNAGFVHHFPFSVEVVGIAKFNDGFKI
jgi:hypothetical protein